MPIKPKSDPSLIYNSIKGRKGNAPGYLSPGGYASPFSVASIPPGRNMFYGGFPYAPNPGSVPVYVPSTASTMGYRNLPGYYGAGGFPYSYSPSYQPATYHPVWNYQQSPLAFGTNAGLSQGGGYNWGDNYGPFGWRGSGYHGYDAGWNPYLGVYEAVNQPGVYGGWRANPNWYPGTTEPAYALYTTGTELNNYGQPAGTVGAFQKKGKKGPGSKQLSGTGSQGGSFFGTAIRSRPRYPGQIPGNTGNTGAGVSGNAYATMAQWRI